MAGLQVEVRSKLFFSWLKINASLQIPLYIIICWKSLTSMPHNLSHFSFQFPPCKERHYNSALSIWLSVDPMADKYPGVSPYAYCANNPVRLVDEDGKEWLDPEKDGKIAGELLIRANDDNKHDYISINRTSIKKQ